jgi:hypothetical protein
MDQEEVEWGFATACALCPRCSPSDALGRFLTYTYPAPPGPKRGGFGTFLASERWSEGTLLFLGFSDKVRDHVEVWFGLG